jgi:DNA-binding NtrC family response regulator
VPPLRERREDIQELAEYFFKVYNRQLGTKVSHIDPSVYERLAAYNWPGNVRELENAMKRSLILCKGEVLTGEDIILDIEGPVSPLVNEKELEDTLTKMLDPLLTEVLRLGGSGFPSSLLEKIEKILVQKALAETRGNQVQAAKLLGVSRNTLRNRMDKYNLAS